MDRLVQDGKVRYVGVSNYNVELMEKSQTVIPLNSLQPPYSILRPQVESEVLPYCIEHGIGVLAYSPLASGLLSGNYTAEQSFHHQDWRSQSKMHIGDGLQASLVKVEKVREIATQLDLTVPQLAVAYVLAHPAVSSALIGVRKPHHIETIVSASDVQLDEVTLNQLREIAYE